MKYDFNLTEKFDIDTPLLTGDGKIIAMLDIEYTEQARFFVNIYDFDGEYLNPIEELGPFKTFQSARDGLRSLR